VGLGAIASLGIGNDPNFLSAEYQALSPRFDVNDLGFLPDFNLHELDVAVGWGERKRGRHLRRWNLVPQASVATTWDGTMRDAIVGSDSNFQFNNLFFTSPQAMFRLPGTWDPFETLDGAYFERPANVDANWVFKSDQSRALAFSLRFLGSKDLGAPGWSTGMVGSVSWQARSNLEIALEPQLGRDENALRFYSCTTDSGTKCVFENGARHYRFAELDSRYLSFTLRTTYTIAVPLSLQAYGQLFLARGDYSRFVDVDTTGARPQITRDELLPTADAPTSADGFREAELNVNLVLRWEPWAGSTLFLVYTRNDAAATLDPSRLKRGPNEDVLALKFVYFAD
jgi:hypothetical protein